MMGAHHYTHLYTQCNHPCHAHPPTTTHTLIRASTTSACAAVKHMCNAGGYCKELKCHPLAVSISLRAYILNPARAAVGVAINPTTQESGSPVNCSWDMSRIAAANAVDACVVVIIIIIIIIIMLCIFCVMRGECMVGVVKWAHHRHMYI